MGIKRNIFKYWGGKQQLCEWIISHFPPNYEKLTYMEPFCGSAVVLLNKAPSEREYINDLDKNLFYIYKAIRERPKEFARLVRNTLFSTNELNYAVDILDGKIKKDDWLLYAWAKYIVMVLSMFGAGSNSLSASPTRNNAGDFHSKFARLNAVRERLKDVQVLNKDAMTIIEQFDRPNTFFYLDPPYPETNQSGYKNAFTMDDFNKMTDALQKISGLYLMSFEKKEGMTCFDDDAGRYFYKKEISRLSKRGINDCEDNKAIEYLMCNYKPECVKQLSFFS